jgi:hypothetical protein
MMYFLADFQRGNWPTPTNAESDDQQSARLVLWTRGMDRPQQPERPSAPWRVCPPHSRPAELQPLLRSH